MSLNLWELAILLMAASGLYSLGKWSVKNYGPQKAPIRKQGERVNQFGQFDGLTTTAEFDRQ